MATAADIQTNVIKRGAAVHIADIERVEKALARVKANAEHVMKTGKVRRRDAVADRQLERAIDNLSRYE